ncbi:hypothetical protein ABH931_002782 [Streptacidiphilus sp. MAP12-33]|uniref:hypothetical protein n=1 Tax=Streptacidiphilus sp. MAP12-33 TaxID=3156266 RepID=UPI00351383AE
MLQFDWFEEDEEDDLSDAQRAFLAVLRSRTGEWPCRPQDTQLVEPEDHCPRWRAVLDVTSELEPLILFTIGVCFDGTAIWAGEVDSGGYEPRPDDQPRVEVIEAAGSPEDLAHAAADWFERVQARPVERREWLRDPRNSHYYVFSDTGVGLCRRGGVHQSPPDRVVHARGVVSPG